MINIPQGYYIKARNIKDSKISIAPPYIREIWDWILRESNHKDKFYHGRKIARGECIRSFKDIQEDLKWMVGYRKETYKKWHCENAMRWLTREGMITTTRTTRGMLIKVLKYDKYQNPKNYENNNENKHESRHENNTKADTINKNEKNEKNKEYINTSKEVDKSPKSYGRQDINEVIEHLKERLGGSPDGSQKQNRQFAKLLIDKLKKDYPNYKTEEQVKILIDKGLEDKFHGKNITNFKYLYYNTQKIIQTIKSEKTNSRFVNLDNY